MKHSFACLCSCLFAAVLAGCGAADRPQPPAMAKVSGTVTLDEKPMGGGEVRFNLVGQPTKILEVKEGAFSREVFVGQNRVAVVWLKDGPPNPMDPTGKLKVNTVDSKFSGGASPFKTDIPPAARAI